MMPTIRAVLSNLLPAEDANSIDIIANEVKYTDAEKKGDDWPYKDLEDRPTLFFCGDGVSGTSLSPFFAGLRPLVI
jgi:2-hydroxy-3-keto-5-methylthiopentenyl-1-phosphate phosphatase